MYLVLNLRLGDVSELMLVTGIFEKDYRKLRHGSVMYPITTKVYISNLDIY